MASGDLPPTEQPEDDGEAGDAGGRGDSFLDQFLRRLDSDVDHHHHHHEESSPSGSLSPSSSPPAPVPSSSSTSLYNPSSPSISQPNSWHFLSSDPTTAYINPGLLLQGLSGGPSGGLHPPLDEFPWILEEFDQQRASLLPGQPSVARLVGDHPDARPNPGQREPYIINMQPYNLPPIMNLQAPSSSSYDDHHDHDLLPHNCRREQLPIHPNPSSVGAATAAAAAAGSGARPSIARASGGYGALQAGHPSTPKEEPGSSYNNRTSSSPIHMRRAATALEATHDSSTSTSTAVRRGGSQRGDNSGLTPSYGLDQSLQGSLQSGDIAEPVPRFERDVVVPGGVELVPQPPGRVRVGSGQFMESPRPMQATARPGRGGAGGTPANNSSVMLGEVTIIGGSAAGATATATSVGTPNTTTSSMSSGGSMSDAGDEETGQEGGSIERSKEAPGGSSGKKRKTPEPSSVGGGAGGDEGEDSSVKSESDTKKSPTTTKNRQRKRGGAKRLREPRYAIKTRTEVDVMDDGFKWRKYGQKAVKNSPHPRNYYRCTTPQCPVRKRVERSNEDSGLVITTYEGTHTHQTPSFHRSASSGYFGDRPMFLNPGQMSPLGPGSPFLPLPPGFDFTPQQVAALHAGKNPQIINPPMSFQGLNPQQIQSAQAMFGFQQDTSMLQAQQYLGLHDHPGTHGPVKLEPFQFTTQQNLQQLRGGHGPMNPPSGLLPSNFPGTRQFQGASGRDSPVGASGSSQLLDAGGSAMRRSSPSRPQGSPQSFTTLDQFNNSMMTSRTSTSSPRSHPQVVDTNTRISDHTLLGTFMQGSSTSTGNFGRDLGGLMSNRQEQMEHIRVSHQVPSQQPVGGDRPRGSTSTSSQEALQDQLQADQEGLLQDMVRPNTGGPGT